MALRWGSKAAFDLSGIHGNGYCSKRCVGKRRKGFGLRGEEDQGLETCVLRGVVGLFSEMPRWISKPRLYLMEIV